MLSPNRWNQVPAELKKSGAISGRVVVAVAAAAAVLGVVAWLVAGRGGGAAAVAAEATPYLQCEACSAARPTTAGELNKLFPLVGLERSKQPALCEKCGKRAVRPALKCPRDGTVFTRKTATDLALEPCPKCGWTQSGQSAAK
jgi:hypothetical protein